MRVSSQLTVKQKFINYLLLEGKKNTSENLFLKLIKELQKSSLKNSFKLLQLTVLHLLPTVRINKYSQKKKRQQKVKEIPSFIINEKNRIFKAVKSILMLSDKKKIHYTYIHLKNEILLSSQNKSLTVEFKNNFQKSAIQTDNLFKYYQK